MARQQTATNERQTQSSQRQGQDVARGEQQRPRNLVRGYDPFGLVLTPLDLFRMNPISLFRRMTEEFDRMGGEPSGRGGEQRPWAPAIEVQQREGNYIIRAELPGVKPDDVKIEAMDEAIVISGERREEQEEERGAVCLTERRYGQFFRTIPVPERAQTDQAKARFDNGVLEITVPVQEPRNERRQIPVEGASTSTGSSGSPAPSSARGSSGSGGSEKAP